MGEGKQTAGDKIAPHVADKQSRWACAGLGRWFLQRRSVLWGWGLLAEGHPPFLESGTGDDLGPRLEGGEIAPLRDRWRRQRLLQGM